jgi:hypothetical protein
VTPRQLAHNEIVVDGKSVYCSANVRTWHETGLWFMGLKPREQTQMVVLHWTAAENPPTAVHRNMSAGGLSVHFVIDQAGTVFQMADANACCAHAKGVNDRSVGIEIINRGDAVGVPDKGVQRDTVIETIHGRQVKYAAFKSAQVVAVVALVQALCEAYGLPLRVPTERGDVVAGALPKAQLASFRGVIGHLHTKSSKRDCGVRLLRLVQGHGGMDSAPDDDSGAV